MRPFNKKCCAERESFVSDFMYDTLGTRNKYFYTYLCCEILNTINVIANIFLVDGFLSGGFLLYGISTNNMVLFPRVTRCIFRKYGRSGELEPHEEICLLSMNVYYEKMYLFLWFWFTLLTCVSLVQIGYSLLLLRKSSSRRIIRNNFVKGTPPEIDLMSRNMQVSFLIGLNAAHRNRWCCSCRISPPVVTVESRIFNKKKFLTHAPPALTNCISALK